MNSLAFSPRIFFYFLLVNLEGNTIQVRISFSYFIDGLLTCIDFWLLTVNCKQLPSLEFVSPIDACGVLPDYGKLSTVNACQIEGDGFMVFPLIYILSRSFSSLQPKLNQCCKLRVYIQIFLLKKLEIL